MKKKKLITIFSLCILLTSLLVVFLRSNALKEEEKEVNISNFENFGSTIAIYIEQTTGQGDYIQKNAVPSDGLIYAIGSSTHCIGGGTIIFNNATHRLSYLFDQADECYVYLDKVDAIRLTQQVSDDMDDPTRVVQINYDNTNTIITSGTASYTEYRYIGARTTTNNYIYFNCDEGYPKKNATDNASHCEKWRIIGSMDTNTTGYTPNASDSEDDGHLVKIIRDTIGSIPWDYKGSGTGSSTSQYGSNDWSDAQLMMMLNPAEYLNQGYRNGSLLTTRTYTLDTSTGKVNYTKSDSTVQSVMQLSYNSAKDEWGGAYYNRANGCKSSGSSLASDANYECNSVNFTTTGLKDAAKNYIQELYWKIGGQGTSSSTAETHYKSERGTATVNATRPTTWKGKIGLMYSSDYGLATAGGSTTSRETCLSYYMNAWNNYSDCYNNDWLFTGTYQWTLTPRSDYVNYVYNIYTTGYVYSNSANGARAVRPVLYLKASTLVIGGTGTEADPYMLM